MQVRNAVRDDLTVLLRMRTEIWADSGQDHSRTLARYFEGDSPFIDQLLVCEDSRGQVIGFAELRLRNYAEGSENPEVPYLEGWFVDARFRRMGVGALLISAAEDWARNRGYSELASDADIDNTASIAAHLSLGFAEVDRSVSFLKKL